MAHIDDKKEIPGRIQKRNFLYGAGAFLLALAALFANADNAKGFLICVIAGGLSIYFATTVKTHLELVGKTGFYR